MSLPCPTPGHHANIATSLSLLSLNNEDLKGVSQKTDELVTKATPASRSLLG